MGPQSDLERFKERAEAVQTVVRQIDDLSATFAYTIDLTTRQEGKSIGAFGWEGRDRTVLEKCCTGAGLGPPEKTKFFRSVLCLGQSVLHRFEDVSGHKETPGIKTDHERHLSFYITIWSSKDQFFGNSDLIYNIEYLLDNI